MAVEAYRWLKNSRLDFWFFPIIGSLALALVLAAFSPLDWNIFVQSLYIALLTWASGWKYLYEYHGQKVGGFFRNYLARIYWSIIHSVGVVYICHIWPNLLALVIFILCCALIFGIFDNILARIEPKDKLLSLVYGVNFLLSLLLIGSAITEYKFVLLFTLGCSVIYLIITCALFIRYRVVFHR